MSAQGLVTYAGVVHPWMCDVMGHMNVRHYVAMFDDASFQLLGRIAGSTSNDSKLGWADVKMEIEYLAETPPGKLVTVRSQVEKVGNSSLSYLHLLAGTLDDVVHARARVVTVRFDLDVRSKLVLPEAERMRAHSLVIPGR